MDGATDLDDFEDPLAPTLDTRHQADAVFVHGAFSDGASRSAAVEHLGDHCPYRIVANPLRGVTSDGAALALLLSIDGPVILIGHSYGGAPLREVGCATDAVRAGVFVAAIAPHAGESFGELAACLPGSDLAGDAGATAGWGRRPLRP